MTASESLEITETVREIIASSTSVLEKTRFPPYLLGRTGIIWQPTPEAKPVYMGGYSLGTDARQAESTARFELTERLLATYELSSRACRDGHYPFFSCNSDQIVGTVEARKVLIFTPPQSGRRDAVGLGFHLHAKAAREHAICEFLERMILGRIWYQRENLTEAGEEKLESGVVRYFTLTKGIPFIMCTYEQSSKPLLTFGASLRFDLATAKEKAKCEALMLAHNALSGADHHGIANNATRNRLISQEDPGAIHARLKYIHSLLRSSEFSDPEPDNIHDLLARLQLTEDEIQYTCLHQSDKGCLYRAFSHRVPSIVDHRRHRKGSPEFLLDPIA